MDADTVRLVTFSTLYPNALMPRHGIFTENRLRAMLASGRAATTVVAPVPWFPFRGARFGAYGTYAAVPPAETRHGIEVLHPRYPVIPRVGEAVAPRLMARALAGPLRRLLARRPAEVLDAFYLYPDGVAAVRLGARLGLPVVVTALGTDVNLIGEHAPARRQMLDAVARAAGVTTVSQALKDRLVAYGADPAAIRVIRHGADLDAFRPVPDRAALRARLGLRPPGEGPVLLSVGNLIELKGHHIAIRALADLPGAVLLIAGHGPERGALERLAHDRGVGDRVRFLELVPHDALPGWYAAADALVLASSREGIPNVVMEAMACGTPVVATAVGGIPEVVPGPPAGRLLAERSPAALAAAVRSLIADPPDRAAVRRHAEAYTWARTTAAHLDVLEAARQARMACGPRGPRGARRPG
jgi:glycosyltransferase involved in cell wall biosynthesis